MILIQIPTETYKKFDKLNLKFTGYSKDARIGKKLLKNNEEEKGNRAQKKINKKTCSI